MGGLRQQCAPCSNSVCCSWMLLGVWGFSTPRARWEDTTVPWHGRGLRPALLLAVGGEKQMPGLVGPSREWHRDVQGAKLGGKLQPAGLTCSCRCTLGHTHTHTPHLPPRREINSPRASPCNPPQQPGQAVALQIKTNHFPPEQQLPSYQTGLIFFKIMLSFLLALKRCNCKSTKQIYTYVRKWYNVILSKLWEVTISVPEQCWKSLPFPSLLFPSL